MKMGCGRFCKKGIISPLYKMKKQLKSQLLITSTPHFPNLQNPTSLKKKEKNDEKQEKMEK